MNRNDLFERTEKYKGILTFGLELDGCFFVYNMELLPSSKHTEESRSGEFEESWR